MKRALVLVLLLVTTAPTYGHARKQHPKEDTWYERALRSINPRNIDYGSMWEERKRAVLNEIGNRYFQYSFAATTAVVVLLTLLCVQRVSHKRALDLAALSIADVLRHDEYSRQVADEAIRRYNEHIESCNRLIEAGQDDEAELERVRKELADTREENKSLRIQLASTQKIVAGMTAQEKPESSAPGHLTARIDSLEKKLRAEQRKNQQPKGTLFDDHRS